MSTLPSFLMNYFIRIEMEIQVFYNNSLASNNRIPTINPNTIYLFS